ncbi:response regulator transcription factor [uncultured Alistipes sp.]|uniref:response regulator transcription factor n=1 Tax=uncultured Alistipes sp. TaxID=538949 RepID=UPI002609DA8E|nr:response regulator transcription factor [uncultured Alistipes sp.]
MKHRILLVDDEPDILEFVGYNLLKAGYEVFTARDGAEGLRMAVEHRPHLILLDRMMPVMDGVETCRRIREQEGLSQVMVVFLSALGEEEQQIEGFDAGADDYIPKPIRMKVLMSRVAAILKRVAADGSLRIDRERHLIYLDGRPLPLPRKEFALLALLSSEPGRLFSREEIYARVWGTEVVVGDRTIDVHVRKLRQKLGDHYISTVKGLGYKFQN